MSKRPNNDYASYHAHVYFDAGSLDYAVSLCQQAGELFKVKVGRTHQRPVGPHPCWSCQLVFDSSKFDAIIPWLDAHRGELSVLVHGLTGHDYRDHTEHASWLGTPVALNLAVFKQ